MPSTPSKSWLINTSMARQRWNIRQVDGSNRALHPTRHIKLGIAKDEGTTTAEDWPHRVAVNAQERKYLESQKPFRIMLEAGAVRLEAAA